MSSSMAKSFGERKPINGWEIEPFIIELTVDDDDIDFVEMDIDTADAPSTTLVQPTPTLLDDSNPAHSPRSQTELEELVADYVQSIRDKQSDDIQERNRECIYKYMYDNQLSTNDVITLAIPECNQKPFTIMNKMAGNIGYWYRKGRITDQEVEEMYEHLICKGTSHWNAVYHKIQKKINPVRYRRYKAHWYQTGEWIGPDYSLLQLSHDENELPAVAAGFICQGLPSTMTEHGVGLGSEEKAYNREANNNLALIRTITRKEMSRSGLITRIREKTKIREAAPRNNSLRQGAKSCGEALRISDTELFEDTAGKKPVVSIARPGPNHILAPPPMTEQLSRFRSIEKNHLFTKSKSTPDWMWNRKKIDPTVVRLPRSKDPGDII